MLKKFSVENFKGFQDKITFDIGSPSNYKKRLCDKRNYLWH